MPSCRLLSAVTALLCCGAIAALSPAAAQGLLEPTDPFADVDFEALKRGGKNGVARDPQRGDDKAVPPPAQPAKRQVREIFSNNNGYAVANRPKRPTVFRLDVSTRLIRITTYHWNNGRGTRVPGTIAVRSGSGQTFGPWDTAGKPGPGGAPNAYWSATPNVRLPPGIYTVVDSQPSTWAHNPASGSAGMAWAEGYAEE